MAYEEVAVHVQICREDVQLPAYARLHDAGMDVRAAISVDLAPQETKIVPTGLKMAIPEGYEIQVRPRSGLSVKTPLRVSNAPGTIDAGYRDEIGIIITNTSLDTPFHIEKGERVAQFVLGRVPRIQFILTDDVSTIGTNRGGGFGSSGVK